MFHLISVTMIENRNSKWEKVREWGGFVSDAFPKLPRNALFDRSGSSNSVSLSFVHFSTLELLPIIIASFTFYLGPNDEETGF